MQFTHYKLGHVERGSIVEVTLQGSAANVRLMDTSNFNSYRAGRSHKFHGGLARKSPVRLEVPRSGTWHVTVDMQGLRGSVRSGIHVIPAKALRPLPAIKEALASGRAVACAQRRTGSSSEYRGSPSGGCSTYSSLILPKTRQKSCGRLRLQFKGLA